MTKFTSLLIIGATAVLFGFMLLRGCTGGEITTDATITTDTITTDVQDTVLNEPEIPTPDAVPVDELTERSGVLINIDSIVAAATNWRHRYRFYKEETLRLKQEIEVLRALVEGAPDCAEREEMLFKNLEEMQVKIDNDARLIDELFADKENSDQLNIYSGKEETPAYQHKWQISVLGGTLPPGGYIYMTDVKQKTITNSLTQVKRYVKKNSAGALIGAQLVDGSFRQVFGMQYGRHGRVMGITGQVMYLPEFETSAATFQSALGLNINF